MLTKTLRTALLASFAVTAPASAHAAPSMAAPGEAPARAVTPAGIGSPKALSLAWLAVKPARAAKAGAPKRVRPLCLDGEQRFVPCTLTRR